MTPRARDRFVVTVAVGLTVNVVFNFALALMLAVPWNETVFAHTAAFTRGEMDADSWAPMATALTYLQSGSQRPVYDELLFVRRVKFQYPPTSLMAVEALDGARTIARVSLSFMLNLVTWLAVAVTAVVTGALLGRGSDGWRGPALVILGTIATLIFYPVVKAYSLGQIQAWLTAGLALLILAWVNGYRVAAGVLLGLVCLVKPHFATVGLWAVVRGESRFLAAAAFTLIGGLGASIWRYGVANHLNYLDAVRFLMRHGESYYPNQSMNGLLHRLVFNGNNLEWRPDAFPAYHPAVFFGTVTTAVVLLALAAWRPRGATGTGPLDLAAMLLACILASPIAWEHHYAVLAPIFAILIPATLRWPVLGRWSAPLLALSYLLSANFLAGAQLLARTAFNPLQSYLYFGALVAFGVLLRARCAEGASSTRGVRVAG